MPSAEHQPVVTGELGIGSRIEHIAAEQDGEREDHRMARPEEMHRPGRHQSLLGGDDHVHQVGEAVALHQRHHSADRMDVHIHRGHLPGAVLPLVGIDRALDHAGEHHFLLDGSGLPGPVQGLIDRLSRLLRSPVGLGEDVQDRPDVRADVPLEGDDVLVKDLDLAVHVALEGAAVGHDYPVVSDELMHPLL